MEEPFEDLEEFPEVPTTNHYYLGSSDHTNVILVSDRFNGPEEFSSWYRSVSMALEGRNKLCFVDGSLPRPLENHPNSRLWSRNNAVVSSWLMHSVSKTIAPSLLHISTARGIWNNLIRRFKQNHVPRRYSIRQLLRSLCQGSSDVSTYYTKLFTLWEELKSVKSTPKCTCGGCNCELDQKWYDHHEEDFVIEFLFGLNDSYESIRGQIIMLDPLPDLEKTYNLIIQHEQQRMIKIPNVNDSHVFQASVNPAENVVAAVSGGNFRPRQRPLCTHYRLYGHMVKKCYKLHGYPPGYKQTAPVVMPRPPASRPPFQPQSIRPYTYQSPHLNIDLNIRSLLLHQFRLCMLLQIRAEANFLLYQNYQQTKFVNYMNNFLTKWHM
ncbi:PREDICTED: uncharacterized protein LOC109116288 [Tarenaya hassleriana]|uniref:uncharacterized protein LOC109116288 n=1 Tax=Tarenaya hassleriana TaxID=28532 RepID=UPI0008FCF93B|nr:PREDICTED: uncharacterized protein LOC109116288 [Tarenaya hassleriana]XP_019056991.1 PREDICTED: uncharacterized protein LOC109116288 [Tarenaya hassleriana]